MVGMDEFSTESLSKATSRDVAFDHTGMMRTHFQLIANFRNHFTAKHDTGRHIYPPFKWQKSFHDHIIRNTRDFENHYQYTVYNYLKHHLPTDWTYTSLRHTEMIDTWG